MATPLEYMKGPQTIECGIYRILFRNPYVFPAEAIGDISKYEAFVKQFLNGNTSKLAREQFAEIADKIIDNYKDKSAKYNGELKQIKNAMLALWDQYVPQKDGNLEKKVSAYPKRVADFAVPTWA